MTSRSIALIVAVIIAAVVIGITAPNTHAVLANLDPTPEPTPIVVPAVTAEDATAEPDGPRWVFVPMVCR